MLWMSIRARWRRAFAPSLAVALLIGVVGGFVLASVAAARRVEGAYQTLIREIDPSDLVVTAGCGEEVSELAGCRGEAAPDVAATVTERLTGNAVVERARTIEVIRPYLVDANGVSVLGSSDNPTGCFEDDQEVQAIALQEGGPHDQVMPFRLEGNLHGAGASGVVMARVTAERIGLRVGDVVRLAGWCSGNGDPVELDEHIDLRITGLAIGAFDVEPPGTNRAFEPMYIDPSVFAALRSAGAELLGGAAVWLDRAASPDRVSEQLASFAIILDLRERTMSLDEALATDSDLLWMLAGVGVATGILLLAPIIGRNLRDTTESPRTMVALGATPRQITEQALAHVGILAFVGALTAAGLGVLCSVVMPIGLGEAILPRRRPWLDGLVTTAGLASIVLLVFAMAVIPAWRFGQRHTGPELALRRQKVTGSARFRPAVHTGLITAVGRPAGRRGASPWPSLISITVAGVVGAAGVTYLAGLHHLKQDSRLVGWNWDAQVQMDDDAQDLDLAAITSQISEIDGVAAVTRGWLYPPVLLVEAASSREVYPFSFDTGVGGVTPTMFRGRAPQAPHEVAINSVLADVTGLGIGDDVMFFRPALVSQLAEDARLAAVESGSGDTARELPDPDPVGAKFEITGITVLAIERRAEIAGASFTLTGLAALLVPSADEITAARAWLPVDSPSESEEPERFITNSADIIDSAPPAYLRFSGDPVATADAVSKVAGVSSVLMASPDQVISDGLGLNLSSLDRVPFALILLMSVAAAAVLLYLLVVTVRDRRAEIAVFRALGLTSTDIRVSVAAQSTVTVLLSLAVAIPAGVVIGRQVWLTYANNLHVIPIAPVPLVKIAIAVGIAIAVANVAGLLLAWSANHRTIGRDLRTE